MAQRQRRGGGGTPVPTPLKVAEVVLGIKYNLDAGERLNDAQKKT